MLFHKKKQETTPTEAKVAPNEQAFNQVPPAALNTSIPTPQTPSNINITLNNSNTNTPVEAPAKKRDVSGIIIKTVSSLVVLAVLGTAIYSVFALIHDQTKASQDGYITLQGKSYAQSVKKYNEFGSLDSTKIKRNKLKDVAVLGNRLFLSESKITPSLYDGTHNDKIISGDGYVGYALYNLTSDSTCGTTLFASSGYSIDLANLALGDYLVYPIQANIPTNNNDRYPYSLASDTSLDESFYSLPDREGNRKRITLKNNTISPYFIIRVEDCGSVLPDDYFDAVVYRNFYEEKDESLIALDAIDDNNQAAYKSLADHINAERTYKVKAVTSLKDAYKTNATLAIGFSDSIDKDFASIYTANHYTGFSTKTLVDSELKGYDYYPEIRELSGYINMSGQGYADVVGNNVLNGNGGNIGKESFLLHSSASINIEDSFKSLLKQVNTNMKDE